MNRKIGFSRIKAVSCIAIIFLHTFYAVDSFAETALQHSILLSIRNGMLWAVPCFVMTSGALLLSSKKELTAKKLWGYIARMLRALILFSLLFAGFDCLFIEKKIHFHFIKSAIDSVLYNAGWSHMWYLYMMIALYLFLPFFKMIVETKNQKLLYYLLGISFLFLSLFPTLSLILGKKISFYMIFANIFPFYFLLGYVLKQINFRKPICILLTILGFLSILIPTLLAVNSDNAEVVNRCKSFFTDYYYLGIVFASVGMYLLLGTEKSGKFDSFLYRVDSLSFGIYLIHMAILKFIIVVLKWNPLKFGGVFMVFLLSIFIFLLSFLLVSFYQKGLEKGKMLYKTRKGTH